MGGWQCKWGESSGFCASLTAVGSMTIYPRVSSLWIPSSVPVRHRFGELETFDSKNTTVSVAIFLSCSLLVLWPGSCGVSCAYVREREKEREGDHFRLGRNVEAREFGLSASCLCVCRIILLTRKKQNNQKMKTFRFSDNLRSL